MGMTSEEEKMAAAISVMTVNESRTESSFVTSMFLYDDFDRTNSISLIKLARYFQWTRVDTLSSPEFILSAEQIYGPKIRSFVSVCDYKINKEMYQLARTCRHRRITVPVKLTTGFKSSGKSTVDFLSTIANQADGTVLATLHYKVTIVDFGSRKSYALPDKTQQLLAPHKDTGMAVERFVPKIRPDEAFRYPQIVQPSDTDINGHTNQASYIKFCLDAATVASLKGDVFKSFQGDILLYHVKRMRMWYAQESISGDSLVVYAWEDKEEPMVINFQVENKGKAIYHSTLWFYSRTSAKL